MSKLKKALLNISFLITVIFPVLTEASTGIAAVVNKTIITTKDLDDRLKLILMSVPQQPDANQMEALKRKALKQMIDEQLQLEETALYEIFAQEDEINRQLQFIEKQNNLQPGELLKKLEENQIPKESLMRQLRAGIAWQKLVGYLASSVELSDQEIDQMARLKQNPNRVRYLLAEIVLPYESSIESVAIENKAQEIVTLLQSGQSFGQLANDFSQNPSALRGGDIDWVEEEQLPAEIRSVVKQTPIGAVTQPIHYDGAVHLILVRAKQSPEDARQKLSVRQMEVPFPLMMSSQQKEEEIQKLESILANVKSCKAFEKAAEKIEGAVLHYHQNINPEQLSGGLDKVLTDLEVGVVSPALPIEERSVLFFMVCEKHEQNKNEDLQEKKKVVREGLEQKKFNELSSKRLTGLRRRSFVDVRI
ncbi:MAG: hypothetical protein CMM87_03440 [Rickettsiales bacterium]|nr:hypothetical protein [Rickettsiales bacterium]|tara:strand:- start:20948 stop:22207 length:1260 start_codon:yes stop_codon:yes gene_type:complete